MVVGGGGGHLRQWLQASASFVTQPRHHTPFLNLIIAGLNTTFKWDSKLLFSIVVTFKRCFSVGVYVREAGSSAV